MQQERSAIRASIDIGSNTIHLVVARCTQEKLDILEEATEFSTHRGKCHCPWPASWGLIGLCTLR